MNTISNRIDDAVPKQAHTITPGAARMRASRERRRNGMRCLLLDITDNEILRLVDIGLLQAADTEDRGKISMALYRFFDESVLGDAQR